MNHDDNVLTAADYICVLCGKPILPLNVVGWEEAGFDTMKGGHLPFHTTFRDAGLTQLVLPVAT